MGFSESEFENEVRRIARLLWPKAEHAGAEIIDGDERDGAFETDDIVHLIECTTSSRKDKAEEDLKSLAKVVESKRRLNPDKPLKGWFITESEPTADQRAVAKKYTGSISELSLDQFRAKLIDARGYLSSRKTCPFGSILDPETGNALQDIEYAPLGMRDQNGKVWSVAGLRDNLIAGKRLVLLGDYGAGKSMTLRECFKELSTAFFKNKSRHFPVYLNLREHYGQPTAAEAFERHARAVGFPNPSHLVRAWRAGFVTLILDGFDEIANFGWTSQRTKLRQNRYQSLRLVRELIQNTPAECGIAIAGRVHFFDSSSEMYDSLSLPSNAPALYLSGFDDEQVQQYLRKHKWTKPVPEWLPARPLLLGYLAARGLLASSLEVRQGTTPAVAWDRLLENICQREARIEAGLSGETIRSVIERLASLARKDLDGIGALGTEDLVKAFEQICGYQPDEKGLLLLQRLPGLGPKNAQDGSRKFIDSDLADVARAGDVVRFIADPYGSGAADSTGWQCLLGELGVNVAAVRLQNMGIADSQLSAAADAAIMKFNNPPLAADIVRVINAMGIRYSGDRLFITEVMIPWIEFGADCGDLSNVEFQHSIFRTVDLDPEAPSDRLPSFRDCHFGTVDGRTGLKDLPADRFDHSCKIDRFGESTSTNDSILSLPLPLGTKVMLTILRKLYVQKGSGRRHSALLRGLDHKARRLVPDVLELLSAENLCVKTRMREETVWLPVRSAAERIARLIAAPAGSGDSLIAKSGQID